MNFKEFLLRLHTPYKNNGSDFFFKNDHGNVLKCQMRKNILRVMQDRVFDLVLRWDNLLNTFGISIFDFHHMFITLCVHCTNIIYKDCKVLNVKLSRGEICVANLIPPANGASLGIYFKAKNLNSAWKFSLKIVVTIFPLLFPNFFGKSEKKYYSSSAARSIALKVFTKIWLFLIFYVMVKLVPV